jgi:outer membrane protein assembly factor BamB
MHNARRRRAFASAGGFIVVALCSACAAAADWPHWRGPTRDGKTPEDSRWERSAWPPKETVWSGAFGVGSSSPIVAGGRLYLTGWAEGKDTVQCVEAATGRPVWKQSYACRKRGRHATGDEGLYEGPISTPEFDPATGLLYTLSVDGHLHCWDARAEGRPVWGLNLYDAFGVPRRPKVGRQGLRDYGYTTAPLVHGDWLLVEVGDDEGAVIAFDKRSGQRRWASQYKGHAGHTGGLVPLTVEGVPCLAVHTLRHLVVMRLDGGHAGTTVAEYEWVTDFAQNIATPAVADSRILITSGYNHGTMCAIDVALAGGATKAWEKPLYSQICSPVVHDGHVYWAWQEAYCVDLATGAKKWAGGKFGDAGSCVVTSDDRMIVWGGRGKLALVELAGRSPARYRELASTGPLFEVDVWPHVALSDGRLFCKDRLGNVKCLGLAPRRE